MLLLRHIYYLGYIWLAVKKTITTAMEITMEVTNPTAKGWTLRDDSTTLRFKVEWGGAQAETVKNCYPVIFRYLLFTCFSLNNVFTVILFLLFLCFNFSINKEILENCIIVCSFWIESLIIEIQNILISK